MAGVDVPNTLDSSEYDAFPFVVSNTSGPVNSFECNISDFIETLNFPDTSGNSYSSSDYGADKDIPLLSDKSCNDNKQSMIVMCKTELNLSGLGDASRILGCDRNPTDFLGFSCINSKSMKFKDVSEGEGSGVLSDSLSTTKNPSERSGFSDCNVSLSVSELNKGEARGATSEKSNGDKEGAFSSDSVFSLSDILSSISLDDDRQQRSNSLKKSSFEICDESLSLDVFKISSNESPIVKNNNSEKDQVNLSDILSSLDFSSKSDLKPNTTITQGDEKLDNGFTFLNFQNNNSVRDHVNFPQFNIDDLIKDVSTENDDKLLASPLKNKQNQEFSFFCDSSENAVSFSEMLNKDCRRDTSKHEQYSISGDSGISMMDFLNSLENTKEISTSSDDSNEPSSPLSSTLEEEEFEAIDLNSCIKSFEDKAHLRPCSIKESCVTPDPRKTPEHLSPDDVLPLPLQHSVIPTFSRKGMKKSLFAKSLSCKPKKDPNLLYKVASIKTDLFNQVFGRPALLNAHRKNPLPDIAKYSDLPTVPYAGHKSYNRLGVTFVC